MPGGALAVEVSADYDVTLAARSRRLSRRARGVVGAVAVARGRF
jgi:hypothetical protein